MKLLKFYASWCAPCKALVPTIDKVVKNNNLELQIIDVDEDEILTKKYNILGIPTVVILNDDGTEKTRLSGNLPEHAYLEALK